MLVVNISRKTHRRLKKTIQIPFRETDKVRAVAEEIKQMLAEHSAIDRELPIHVFLQTLGDYAGHIEIDAYAHETNIELFNMLQQEVLLKIYAILNRANIELAVPTYDIKEKRG